MNRTVCFVSESTPHSSPSEPKTMYIKLKETFVTVMCKNSDLATPADAGVFQVKLPVEICCPQAVDAFMKPFDVLRSSFS